MTDSSQTSANDELEPSPVTLILYHGTSEAGARGISQAGIVPRNEHPSHWAIASRHDLVYLTSTYAPFFALSAMKDGDSHFGLVEVEVSSDALYPDEDFLEQATRGHELAKSLGIAKLSMAERAFFFRDELEYYASHALESLSGLGNVATWHVPRSQVQRIAIIPYTRVRTLVHRASDPSICIANHVLMGDQYRALTRAFFAEPVTGPELFFKDQWPLLPDRYRQRISEELAWLRSGDPQLEIHTLSGKPESSGQNS